METVQDATVKMPRIRVTVEYDGAEATHEGAIFVDAISFLCKCHDGICHAGGMPPNLSIDMVTAKAGRERLRRLLAGGNGA